MRRWLAFAAAVTGVAAGRAQSQTMSLAGAWRFKLDRAGQQLWQEGSGPIPEPFPPGAGIAERWYDRRLPDGIRLPGLLQAQGYGDPIATNTPWVLTLGDAWWKLQPVALRARFSQPGRVKVPFLSQPPRHFLGPAWYQRDITIPAAWAGRHIELYLERPHWATTVWLDDRAFPTDVSLVAPHIVAFGPVAPGTHRLTLRVDNRRPVASDQYNGHADDAHSVSDALGAAWNGVVGRIELRAYSPVWIEDAQVFPRLADRSALIQVRIGNDTGRPGAGVLTAGGASTAAAWTATGGTVSLRVALGSNAQPWDEFHPHLLSVTVALRGGGADDRRRLTFGLREISHRGSELLLNGRPINLRLDHFGGDFPLTGYPAMDVASWKRIIRVCQAYGLNGMRFHSWCPPEAAFEAADELGFYLQPECGMWNPLNPGGVYAKMLERETARLLEAYGNHPSFILLSPSNEPSGHYLEVTPEWARAWYARDPRRLYAAGTGWDRPAQVYGGPQYATLVRFQGGQLRGVTGWFGRDFRKAVAGVPIPILSHEVGQWCSYPDFGVIRSFTGYLQPGNFEIFRYIARKQGVLGYDAAFARASGEFQLACYKEEIEANLRTPGLSGYELLDLHDYLGQGTALIGVLDAFWHPKSYVTAAEFRRFNGPTVPLARLTRRVFTTADLLNAKVELYHFGPHPLVGAVGYWKIVDPSGATLAGGQWPARIFPIGKNEPMGDVSADLSRLPAPAAYRLVVGLTAEAASSPPSFRPAAASSPPLAASENAWRFWLYPARISPAVPAGVTVAHDWPAARTALRAGDRVVFFPAPNELDPARCPPLDPLPVFWNIQMTVRPPLNPTPRFDAMLGLLCENRHPALAEFPTGIGCDWEWTPLFDHARSVNLSAAPPDLRPIVAAIDDWNRDWRLGVIFEARVGQGRLLVCALDLDRPDAVPGARQLRRSLLDYAAGPRFRPTTRLTLPEADALWANPGHPAPAIKRAYDRDLDEGPTRAPGL